MSNDTSTDLVVFGEDWGRHPSSTQHLVKRLAERRRVVWVNSIGLRRPRANLGDIRRVVDKLARRRAGGAATVTRPESLSIVPPLAVSWPGSRLAAWTNRRTLAWQVRRALDRRGMRRPILWTSLPTAATLVGALDERAVVYYCGDDFSALSGVDHTPVAALEQELVECADLIVAASPELAARFPASRTLLLPHGADIAHFGRPATIAEDLSRGRPVAGFYGSISDWLDVSLLAHTARGLPDWDFLLIGEVRTNVDALRGLPNVRLVGARDHGDLPAYVQHWQVSLLPFRDTPQIRACNPLKLREYLAAGTPIVSTPFPALRPYLDLVEVVPSAAGFVAAIRNAAADTRRNVYRRSAVRDESWEQRATELDQALAGL
ncbi:MAG: glycosyltransferase [Reyranellaceae bacterium]